MRASIGLCVLSCLLALGCQSAPRSTLPPPPPASFGNELGQWDAPPSHGGVGVAGLGQTPGGPSDGPRFDQEPAFDQDSGFDPAPGFDQDVTAMRPDRGEPGFGPTPDVNAPDLVGGMSDIGGMTADPNDGMYADAGMVADERGGQIGSGMRVTAERAPVFATRPFRWHTSLSAAQADAREQGKLIMLVATRPNCGLCERFKNVTADTSRDELGQVAVGYSYNAMEDNAESRRIYQMSIKRMPRAKFMPLVAFVTPDMQWVHGFSGMRTRPQLRGDILRVQTSVPALQRPVESAPRPYRETPLADARGIPMEPAPDGYGMQPGFASDSMAGGGMVADGGFVEPRAPLIYDDDVPSVPAGGGMAPDAVSDSTVADGGFSGQDFPDRGGQPEVVTPPIDARTPPASTYDMPMAAGAGAPPTGNAVPSSWMPDAPPISASGRPAQQAWLPPALAAEAGPWGQAALRNALSQMRGKRYGAAKSTLDEIIARMGGTEVERQARKGTIAIYNAKRIDRASTTSERQLYESRAQRDLGDTIWSVLF